MITKTVRLERLRGHRETGRETLAYFVRPGSRSRPWIWLSPDVVPPFTGETATAIIARTKAGGWRVIELVDPKPPAS